jgi:prepilin-type N-terminal cleavage/methylation domain-containing protein
MKKTLNRGFTLIELLVVIAIIGILASVILASLNTARAKGADAAAKEDLDNSRAQAQLYYDSNTNSYGGVCTALSTATPGGIKDLITDAGSKESAPLGAGNAIVPTNTVTACHDTASSPTTLGGWAAETPLHSYGTAAAPAYWCVDGTGTSKQDATALPTNQITCP